MIECPLLKKYKEDGKSDKKVIFNSTKKERK